MPVLGAATLELNADSAKLEQDLGRAVQQGAAFGAMIGEVVGKAVVRVADHLLSLTRNAIDSADELHKMSQKIGVSVESLSELAVAAKLADVPLSTLRNGLKELATHASDAMRNAKGKSAEAFKAMGLDVQQFGGDTEAIFNAVMEKLGSYEDDANKVALANALMGRSAQELIPMANELAKSRQIARELGITLDSETAAAANRFKDNLTISKIASEAMGARISAVLLPSLEKLSGVLVANAKDTERLDTVTRAADAGLKIIATGATIAAAALHNAGQMIGGVGAVISLMLTGKFKEADETMARMAGDFVSNISEAASSVGRIWSDAGEQVAAKAEENGEKLAAPALKAAEKVKSAKKEFDEFKAAVMRAYDDAANAAAADQEIEKKLAEDREKMMKQVYENDDKQREAEEERERIAAGVGQEVKRTDGLARDLGLTFTSAFEDAIVGGKGLRDVLSGIGQDLLRLAMRKMITEPIGKMFTDSIEGAGGISGLGSILFPGGGSGGGGEAAALAAGIQPLATGTDFIHEDGLKYLHRGEAVVPASENGRGGPNVYIDARGADAGVIARLERKVEALGGSMERRAVSAQIDAARRGVRA